LFIYETLFDFAGKQLRAAEINEKMAAAGFWDSQEKAQQLMGELRKITALLKPLSEVVAGGDDLAALLELVEEDPSAEMEAELSSAMETLSSQVEGVELQATMSGEKDASNAFVSIQAGEGGADSADWASMLMRMYQRWAEERGFKTEVMELSVAEEAGIRNALLAIRGDYAYGYLKGETGVHRLIRISPFDSAGRRHTAFAAVDVTPEVEEDVDIQINWEKDVREDTFRAGGAGGQHVNKTDSAIRLTHLETNEVVQCQNERSQHKNRATARKMLIAKLFKLELERREAEVAARRGQKSKIGFGGETIRNYVLNPEQFVKDTRSNFKVGNPAVVLDGGLDPFLEAYLRWTIGKEA